MHWATGGWDMGCCLTMFAAGRENATIAQPELLSVKYGALAGARFFTKRNALVIRIFGVAPKCFATRRVTGKTT